MHIFFENTIDVECNVKNTVQISASADPRTQFVDKNLDEYTPNEHFDQCTIFTENTTDIPQTIMQPTLIVIQTKIVSVKISSKGTSPISIFI